MALTKVDISIMDNVGTTANKLLAYDGSGNLPAVDGSQLINPNTGSTKSASDPTISTNPSGGVGTEWQNTTSGEVYICTDATAGENVWKNVGEGSGNITPWQFGGTTYGYGLGGNPAPQNNVIDKYSYASDANATDVGNMLYGAQGCMGNKGTSYGYVAGGEPSKTDINKFSYSSDGNATDVGDLTIGRAFWHGAGASSGTYIYWMGGEGGGQSYRNVIDKNSVSTDANATDVGDLVVGTRNARGNSSATYGYCMGGDLSGTPESDVIQRWAFASDGNAVDTTANLLTTNYMFAGNASSTTHGYVAGGIDGTGPSNRTNKIQKHQFDTSNNATDVGDLTGGPNSGANSGGGGSSSTTYGYRHGGWPSYRDEIEKWAFASDGNGIDVGNLSVGREDMGGTQA